MVVRVSSGGVLGVDALLVVVEVETGGGLSLFTVVGLPEAAVRESQVRVKSAIRQSGEEFPTGRVVVNLAPADVRKVGTAYDLPLSVGLLAARRHERKERVAGTLFYGELGLDGQVRKVPGVLPIALLAQCLGYQRLVVARDNGAEAAVVQGLEVFGVSTLSEVIDWLDGRQDLMPVQAALHADVATDSMDMAEVRGQPRAKRAMEIAAAGGHNLLMCGSPGSGKTMLARRLVTILPSMTLHEQLETTKIYSVSDLLPNGCGLIRQRPFRAPHHTASDVALVGGGSYPRPGEVSLAHNGVLFLDELPEFRRTVLEVLRQPLEDRQVTVSRARLRVTFPATFMLVAAMNPCPCGYLHDLKRTCSCSDLGIERYRSRISGPLLDRIDLLVDVKSLPFQELTDKRQEESSAAVRARVESARRMQRTRFQDLPVDSNALMGPREIQQFCTIDPEGERLLALAADKYGLTARTYHRLLKVSRTMADLEGSPQIRMPHLREALSFRVQEFQATSAGKDSGNLDRQKSRRLQTCLSSRAKLGNA